LQEKHATFKTRTDWTPVSKRPSISFKTSNQEFFETPD